MFRKSIRAGACLAALFAAPALSLSTAAHAHVVLDTAEAQADSYARTVFIVPHGCQGAPTTALSVRLPDGILIAKPQPKPGWTAVIVKTDLPAPVTGPHGRSYSQAVSEIIWSGGTLPDDQFDEFKIHLRLPAAAEETVLHFPVLQTCGESASYWAETAKPGEGRPAYPAPALTLTPGGAPQHHHAH